MEDNKIYRLNELYKYAYDRYLFIDIVLEKIITLEDLIITTEHFILEQSKPVTKLKHLTESIKWHTGYMILDKKDVKKHLGEE